MATTPKIKPPVRLRMDKSKYFSTVHGERAAGDPHAKIHFYQDGLPFDGEGLLLVDLVPDDKRELVDRRLKKLAATVQKPVPEPVRTAPVADPESDDGDDDADNQGDDAATQNITPGDVNLESWLRGEANYVWFSIPAAIRQRFSKNVSNKTDAVTYLVEEEKVVTPDQLSEALKPHYVPTKG